IWGTGQFGGFLDGIWQSANTQMKGWQSASRYVPEEIRIQQEQDLKNTMGAHYYTQTQAGFMELTTRVWNYFNQRTAVDLGAYPTAGRRGGRG
ncbi:MAG: hypothetical protein GWN18_04405, partial [Thermoplasmata archaeon]|nr:hypothetical protein [Thermoplasmata archaeon]NIV28606.1 hypothetical protein [Anaerolineae bacterium]NIS19211.1 hypothetical protein [Thermoplasmata archaeon]NIT76187.1 hypothetical protein [Thermoplasmata archaeon]NIU48346.1 hypothetical protein [Thermoplasmata archaeon]